MATDDLAAEVAAHRLVRSVRRGRLLYCAGCGDPWPCLVRRLADENERLRAALAEEISFVELDRDISLGKLGSETHDARYWASRLRRLRAFLDRSAAEPDVGGDDDG